MHVVAHRSQIPVAAAVHDQRLVAAAEQMPEELVPAIEPAGVSDQKPFHARHQIGLRRLNHQMKMIWHQTIRLHLPTGFETSLAHRGQETLAVSVIFEYRYAPIP